LFFEFSKVKKDRLSKTTYFNDDAKLKEYYVKICKNLNCFGSILFKVKEIVYDMSDLNKGNGMISFKKVILILSVSKAITKRRNCGISSGFFLQFGKYSATEFLIKN
jgi:hypothetical protein